MAGDPADLIGRATQRSSILAALGADGAGSAAVILTGEAGIGKTAIWESIVADRRSAGEHVLVSRATEAEARLPWVGLADLLRSIPSPVQACLPDVQQRALQAVSLQHGGADALDERTVGTAILSALQIMTESAPVLLAVDDLPCLDVASTFVVAFALRRVEGRHPARLFATARGHDVQLPALRGLPADRSTTIAVGPMTLGALFALLQSRLGIRLPRPLLLRVYQTSGGNPLYALELGRALDRLEISPKAGSPLPVPVGLDALVDARVRDLRPDVAELVAATAASWHLSATDADADAIERAVAAGMVVVDEPAVVGGHRVVRAAHPLLSASAYNCLTAARRRALHLRLASATSDPVERVRHAALAATEPRADLADELDQAVIAVLAAGVPDLAAELAQLALEHTTDNARRAARLDRLADARFRAGDSAGAWRAQTEAMAATAPGAARARRRIRLAEIVVEVTGWENAERELQMAVEEASEDPRVLAEALLTLAAATDDIDLAEVSSQRALDLIEAQDEPDPVILSGALDQVAGARFRAGRGLDHDMFARAIAIERAHPYRRLSDRADTSYAALLKYADDLDGAEDRLCALLDEARAIGDLSSISYVLGHLVHISLWRGQLARGRDYADEHVELCSYGELGGQAIHASCNLGLVMAYQGALDDAHRVLSRVLADPTTSAWFRTRANAALGFVALSRSDPAGAVGCTDLWHDALTQMHFAEPGYSRSHLDHFCALIGTGRTADAEAFHAELDGQARRSGRMSAAAVALTGRAMLDAHSGRLDDARSSMTAALNVVRHLATTFRPRAHPAHRRPDLPPCKGEVGCAGPADRGRERVHVVRCDCLARAGCR